MMINSITSLGVPHFREKEGKRIGVEWAELPQEIIELISKRLTIYIDYLHFRCVCRNWNSYVPKIPLHLPPQLPWLMLSHKSFFDLSTNKLHRLNLPSSSSSSSSSSSHQTRIVGSSNGWLVILDKTNEIHLLNPLTCATVSLPSLHTFPELVRMLFLNHNNYLIKVVLSSSPLLSKDFSALAILSHKNLAFCRKDYDSWVLLNVNEHHQWIDAVYKNSLFYVVSTRGTIAVCDVEGSGVSIIETTISIGYLDKICYVMFSGEDMLVATRDFLWEFQPQEFGPDPDVWTVGFVIFKMNWNLLKWEEIQTLGEHSLFVGKNYSLSFCAADFVGCSPNCIYFTDDIVGKHDFGIYNLSDESIEPLPCYPQNSYCRLGCPIWVTPNP